MSVKSEEILLDNLVRAYTMDAVQVDSELEWITDDDELDQGVCWQRWTGQSRWRKSCRISTASSRMDFWLFSSSIRILVSIC